MIDADFINPIWPGFSWSQEFELDAALAPAGAALRILLTAEGQTQQPGIAITLTRPDAVRHRMELTGLQTVDLRAPGMLWGDFVLRHADASETPINLRIAIPVEKPLTPPVAP